jgi:raffinose/stachyose/melibiose transport system substrate-binding protein
MTYRMLLTTALVAATAIPAAAQELRFFNVFDATATSLWQPVLEAYTAATGTPVVSESIAGSGAAVYPDVLRTSIASGSPPDVFFMWGGTIAQPFIDAGQVREISDLYEKYGWVDRFPPWIIDRLRQPDGTIYGVPFKARGMGLWYKKAIFEQYGLTEPKTYAELEQICTVLAENGKSCASFGGQFGWHTMRLVDYFLEDTCGPEVHDAINAREQTWNQPCVVDAFARLKLWVDNKWLVPDFLGVTPADARMPMYLDNAAMVYEGGWFENVLTGDGQNANDYAFFLPPTASGRYHAFPEQWMIPVDSPDAESAGAYLDWVTSGETHVTFAAPFEGSVSEGYSPDCTTYPHACAWTEILTSDRGTYPPTDQAFEKELIDGFFEAQDGVVAGRMTPEESAALIQTYVEQHDSRG